VTTAALASSVPTAVVVLVGRPTVVVSDRVFLSLSVSFLEIFRSSNRFSAKQLEHGWTLLEDALAARVDSQSLGNSSHLQQQNCSLLLGP